MLSDAEPATSWGAITAVAVTVGFIAQIVLQVLARWDAARTAAKAQAAASNAATQVSAVKRTLETATATSDAKLDSLGKVATATHALVNNNMAVQLRLNAALARRLAELTRDLSDIRAADLADQLLAEHEAKQAVVDAAAGPK